MTEERERYDWETEDGTGTAAVPDVAPDAVSVEEALLALGARVNDLAWKIERQDDVLDILRRHLNKLQDANIAPMLESSAVIVQLTRIADAMVRQTVIAEALLPIHQATAEQTERATRVIETRHASADTDDCDELWRLARDLVFATKGQETALRYDALDIYVREHTP